MKICWDNLESIRINRKGNLVNKFGWILYEFDSCKNCKKPFLGRLYQEGCGCHRGLGKKHSQETLDKLKASKQKEKNNRWKGGVTEKKIPLYDTYALQLEPYEECRRQTEDPNILEVKCAYCGKWFTPKIGDINNRIRRMEAEFGYFYCLDGCRQECPIYYKHKYSKDHPKNKRGSGLNIEVPPEFRQMVFARDNYTCQKCGSTKSLQCHHIIPKKISPMEALDIGNGITLCKECHKWVHMNIPGCGYSELAKLEVCN